MGYRPRRATRGRGSALRSVRNLSRKCRRKILVPELHALGWHCASERAGDSRASGHQVDRLQTDFRRAAANPTIDPIDSRQAVEGLLRGWRKERKRPETRNLLFQKTGGHMVVAVELNIIEGCGNAIPAGHGCGFCPADMRHRYNDDVPESQWFAYQHNLK